MKKTMKILAIIAAILLGLGIIVSVGAIATAEDGFHSALEGLRSRCTSIGTPMRTVCG